ncbi:MAG: N-acetylmuramoyl-L-alanine amidase-like domain-containing protein [Ignavibacteria bacterium]
MNPTYKISLVISVIVISFLSNFTEANIPRAFHAIKSGYNNCADDYEIMKCKKKLISFDASLKNLPINEVIGEVGKTFMGTPYVAGTLDENNNSEEVVVRITGLDCVTFVENVLIFSRLIKDGKNNFEDYTSELEKIRYRDGKNSGYASRLHYFTDWIYDNERKGILKDITEEIGGTLSSKYIGFMTSHRKSYKQLSDNDLNYSLINEVETNINSRKQYYIPKEEIANFYDKLQTGDIVGLTSTLDGLDVAHTGLVYKKDGMTFLMHASLKNKEVEISRVELQDYLMSNAKQSGIVVARIMDVK